ncbi:hypothetical protein NC653_027917 [Populus alba x Populus x berolinensis]|uniref:Uncharacterized protein n=1 Tax=Populus alba x Populus x berolinensis TaxID=444605 RepID=A0AAD6M6N2_9ROSI|nr:hypothetical protein NC653_027917 [Populus alba x Populus x berolinensis]
MGKNLFSNPTLAKATVISEIDSQVQFPNKKKKEKFIRIQTHLFSPLKISSLLAVFFFPFLRFASSRVLPRTSSFENQHHERISAGLPRRANLSVYPPSQTIRVGFLNHIFQNHASGIPNQGWKEPLPEAHGPHNETNKIYCTLVNYSLSFLCGNVECRSQSLIDQGIVRQGFGKVTLTFNGGERFYMRCK